jgi:hypothetical protein
VHEGRVSMKAERVSLKQRVIMKDSVSKKKRVSMN